MRLTKRKRTLVAIWSSALSCAGILDPRGGGGGGGGEPGATTVTRPPPTLLPPQLPPVESSPDGHNGRRPEFLRGWRWQRRHRSASDRSRRVAPTSPDHHDDFPPPSSSYGGAASSSSAYDASSSSSAAPLVVASPWLEFQTPSIREALAAIRFTGGRPPLNPPPPDPEEDQDHKQDLNLERDPHWRTCPRTMFQGGSASSPIDPWPNDDGPPSLFQLVPRPEKDSWERVDVNDDEDDPTDGAATVAATARMEEEMLYAAPAQLPPLHSPLVYRFYGKSRSRTLASGSIPFVLLGPNVDHFKVIGQELAARGFSVLACERVRGDSSSSSATAATATATTSPDPRVSPPSPPPKGDDEDGALLVRELLDALRWNQVVLVGCDSEALLTVQAALSLAPTRVAGLVLCGDLDAVDAFVVAAAALESNPTFGGGAPSTTTPSAGARKPLPSHFSVDLYLRDHLPCPFTVVWAGDVTPTPPGHPAAATPDPATFETLAANRYHILGGGAAPHRRRPELVAWVLTRFVEERIATPPSSTVSSSDKSQLARQARGGRQQQQQRHPPAAPPIAEPRPLNRLVRLRELLWSPGSFIVTGRMVATTILYWAVLKVAIHQFDNVCYGMVNVQSAVKSVQSVRQVVWRWAIAALVKVGSLFVLTSDDRPGAHRLTHREESDGTVAAAVPAPEVPPGDGTTNKTSPAGLDEADDGADALVLDDEGEDDGADSTVPPRSNTSAPAEPPHVPLPDDSPPMRKPLFFLDNVVA